MTSVQISIIVRDIFWQEPVSRSPCTLLKQDFLTNQCICCMHYALVRKSSLRLSLRLSKVQWASWNRLLVQTSTRTVAHTMAEHCHYTRVYARVRACTRVYARVRACTRVYARVRAWTRVYARVRACTRVYARVRACTRVYARVRACTRVYARVRACTRVYARVRAWTRVYARVRACTRVYARVRACTRVYARVRACTRVYARVRACTRVYARVRACTRVYARVRACTRVYARVRACTRVYARVRANPLWPMAMPMPMSTTRKVHAVPWVITWMISASTWLSHAHALGHGHDQSPIHVFTLTV